MRNSFILHLDSLVILEEMTNEQAGKLFKNIYSFVKNPNLIININDKVISDSFFIVKNEIKEDWSTSYIKNGKIKYHWNWKGGITPENHKIRQSNQYREWRKKVFERDNYSCYFCGKSKTELNAHHLKKFSEYPELRFDIDNGVTACVKCHRELHSGGKNER